MYIKSSIIEKLKKGSEEAFNHVYEHYYRLVYYIIYSLVKHKQTTEDLSQEAFIKMYHHISQLNDNDKFHQWFIRLTKNIVYNYLNKEKKQIEVNSDIIDHYPQYSPPRFDYNRVLNDFENYVITLHFVYNLSFKEISEETGKSMSIITKAYYKALKKLRKEM